VASRRGIRCGGPVYPSHPNRDLMLSRMANLRSRLQANCVAHHSSVVLPPLRWPRALLQAGLRWWRQGGIDPDPLRLHSVFQPESLNQKLWTRKMGLTLTVHGARRRQAAPKTPDFGIVQEAYRLPFFGSPQFPVLRAACLHHPGPLERADHALDLTTKHASDRCGPRWGGGELSNAANVGGLSHESPSG
jgi:hypothetical protein